LASRTNRPPMSISKLHQHLGSKADRTAVVVGTVTDDERVTEMPKLNVAALRFTEAARARITKAGGKCLTLDELVMMAPTGKSNFLDSSLGKLKGADASVLKFNYNLLSDRYQHPPP